MDVTTSQLASSHSAFSPSFSNPSSDGKSMVVVMGVTGSGKSYLVNKLAGKKVVKEGKDLASCTQECQLVPANIGNTRVLLIDTPGFDDPQKSDSQILSEIARLLAAQYDLGFQLKGIIYAHRITDIRYCGSAVKTFEIFKRICGEEALSNVLLATTRWGEIDEVTGASREHELRRDFWGYMVGRGSLLSRFHGDRASAVALISQLIIKNPVVLRLQHEMINEGKKLHETEAGLYVNDDLNGRRHEYLEQLDSLEKLRKELQDNDRAMRRQLMLDLDQQHAKIRKTEEDQSNLRADVAGEVREEIRTGGTPKSNWVKKLYPFLPVALGILGMFVGIPPGAIDLFSGWFEEEA